MAASAWWRRLREIPDPIVDAGIALAIALLITASIHESPEPNSRTPNALAYGLGLTFAALLLFRRRWPRGVLIAGILVLNGYLALDFPAVSPFLFLAIPLYTAAAAGYLRSSLMLGALVVIGEVFGRLIIEQDSEPVGRVLYDVLRDSAFVVAVLLLGDAVHSRRVRMAEARERLMHAEAERERETQRRVTEERLRIARELHDVLAHTLAVMMVQTGLAADLVDEQPAEAKATLRTVRAAGREAMSELRATVSLLRSGDPDAASRAPMPGLSQVDGLLETASSSGLRVDLQRMGELRALPPAVDLTAYRIVQEALTNVVRHAHASSATVTVRYGPSDLVIEVMDDGRGCNGRGAGSGHGLAGMAERAAAVGGSLESGPAPAGGFRVRARLPVERVPA